MRRRVLNLIPRAQPEMAWNQRIEHNTPQSQGDTIEPVISGTAQATKIDAPKQTAPTRDGRNSDNCGNIKETSNEQTTVDHDVGKSSKTLEKSETSIGKKVERRTKEARKKVERRSEKGRSKRLGEGSENRNTRRKSRNVGTMWKHWKHLRKQAEHIEQHRELSSNVKETQQSRNMPRQVI